MHLLITGCSGIVIESSHYRGLFLEVLGLFSPTIFGVIAGHHFQRDVQLANEAIRTIAACTSNMGPGARKDYIRLKMRLELQTVLCTEYRCAWSPTVGQMLVFIFSIKGIHTLQP